MTPLYDAAITLLTREPVWRTALVDTIALKNGERPLDVGYGAGSLIALLAPSDPGADIHGVDPDSHRFIARLSREGQRDILSIIHRALKPGGRPLIADFGL